VRSRGRYRVPVIAGTGSATTGPYLDAFAPRDHADFSLGEADLIP
jgi:hypothetical protein